MMPPLVGQKELVRQLGEASRLLELLGAPGYRVNLYAGAARQLDAFSGSFAELFNERRLSELRGIGDGLAAELYALRARPRLAVLDELYAQVPEGVRGLLQISGLGPKKARLLWLGGIEDVTELVAAIEDGRVAKLRGFGAKSAKTILAAAKFALRSAARLRLDEAEVIAAAFGDAFIGALPDATLSWTGELRRSLETVGTLQALVTGVTADALGRGLTTFCREVDRAETGFRVVFGERKLELTPVQPSALGTTLILETGDEAFAAALQARAEEQGLELTRAGLFRAEERLPTPSETDVFKLLELPYTPPERRDVPLGLPAENLLTLADIRGLVHNHSSWSDGAAPLREMVAKARALGYSYLATADHSKTSYYANGLSVERVFAQAKEIRAIQRELQDEGSDFRVLHGLEVDIMPDGTLDYPDEVLATLDYAVVSVHQHFTLDKAKQTERVIRAVQNPYANILAHMTGRLLLRRPSYELDVEAVLQACAETGTVVELNANPYRLDLDWREVIRARELGCRFSIDPDAHHPDGYRDLRYGVMMARKAGLTAAEVVNTAPNAEAFLARLAAKPNLPSSFSAAATGRVDTLLSACYPAYSDAAARARVLTDDD